MRLAAALAVVLVAGAVWAQTPAPPASRDQALADLTQADVEARRRAAAALGEVGRMEDVPALVQALRDGDGIVRALAENSLWGLWSHSGDPEIDALFELGVEQMNLRQGPAAIAIFTRIIEKKPEFAEGWNKRATVYFLMGEYEKSLHYCDEVMERNPSHFGALAGYGQIYLRLGLPERALPYFQRALAVNPNMEGVAQMVEEIKALLAEKRRESV
jgi:tetratricopeptide (TPR) repeat protein